MIDEPLTIEQFTYIAAAILGIDADEAAHVVDVGKASSALAAPFAEFGGHVLFPDPVHRCAVTCSRIVRNHALPDENKRAGVVAMETMLEELGLVLVVDDEPYAATIEQLAASDLSEAQFIAWVEANLVALA